MACDNLSKNKEFCNCSYSGCAKQGKCCECLQYHLKMQQLPACCFPKDAEATYDRSFKKFVEVCKTHYGIQ
jgi:hypothetical protein